jgi:glycine/D-amino acid oxidase-like deaminating enzyme
MRDPGRVVIVGAGIAGVATAFQLSRRGVREIVIVEREAQVAAHASGRNAAIFRLLDRDRSNLILAQESQAQLAGMSWSQDVVRSGGALTVVAADGLARLRDLAYVAREEGVDLAEWTPGRAADLVPALDASRVAGVLHVPGEGTIDIDRLVHGALEQARAAGVQVRLGCGVRGVGVAQGRVRSVETDAGEIEAALVVNAAGAWAADLGRQAGAALLPLRPVRRHLAFLRVAGSPAAWPVVWDLSTPLYFRPESGGVLVSLCEEIPSQPGDESCDDHLAERLAAGMNGLRPPLDDAHLVRAWACQRTIAPDDRFVVGPDSRLEGFFWVAGLGGHGMSAGLAAARVAADLIVGEHPVEADVLSPGRFAEI